MNLKLHVIYFNKFLEELKTIFFLNLNIKTKLTFFSENELNCQPRT